MDNRRGLAFSRHSMVSDGLLGEVIAFRCSGSGGASMGVIGAGGGDGVSGDGVSGDGVVSDVGIVECVNLACAGGGVGGVLVWCGFSAGGVVLVLALLSGVVVWRCGVSAGVVVWRCGVSAGVVVRYKGWWCGVSVASLGVVSV